MFFAISKIKNIDMEEKESYTRLIFEENEREANRYACKCLQVMALIALIAWILNLMHIFIVPHTLMNVGMPVCILSFLLPTFISRAITKPSGWFKYLILGCCILGITVLHVAIPKHTLLAWMAPVLLSSHYYSRRLTVSTLVLSTICMCISFIIGLFVGEGDPNLIDASTVEQATITSVVFWNAVLFYLIPRAASLIGLSFVCITITKRTHGLLERQVSDFVARQRIETELNVAAQIQADMLPRIFPAFSQRKEFDIYASMSPAKEVGGDFYDFFLVDDDHLALVIADVSGKGVPAAMFMVIAKTLLKNAVQSGMSPALALETVNDQLCENNDAEMFVTVWLGVYEISTGKLTAANAGHEYPVIRHENGCFELYKDKHGFVLAGMKGVSYREYTLELGIGDTLFVYTDGVPEATNGENVLYGTTRMLEALNKEMDTSPEKLLHAIKRDISLFVGNVAQFDDITMLAILRKE